MELAACLDREEELREDVVVNKINPKLCSKPSKLPHCSLPTCLGIILGGIIDDTEPHKCAIIEIFNTKWRFKTRYESDISMLR